MKKILALFVVAVLASSIAGCGAAVTESFDMNADWDTIVKQADGQAVSFYGWGGNEDLSDAQVENMYSDSFSGGMEYAVIIFFKGR